MDLIYFTHQPIPYACRLLENLNCSQDNIDAIEKLVECTGIATSFGILNGVLERRLMAAPLISLSSSTFPTGAGLYAIFCCDELVYIGSSDEVRHRMGEHRRSVLNASGLDIEHCFCRCVTCPKMAALSCEEQLIEVHQPPWNKSGFGSKNSALFSQSEWNQKYGRTLPLLDNSLRLRESHASAK